jgi:hypothetical protein
LGVVQTRLWGDLPAQAEIEQLMTIFSRIENDKLDRILVAFQDMNCPDRPLTRLTTPSACAGFNR